VATRWWSELRSAWEVQSFYRRFETIVALALRVVIATVILVALYRLVVGVITTVVLRSLNPLEHAIFQQVFGQIMTLLIALEFNHTLQYTVSHTHGVVQARTVILIALLALARKAIVMEPTSYAPASMLALAALTLSLGVTYRLMRDLRDQVRDDS